MNEQVKIIDTATPFLKMVAHTMPKEMGRAIKSAGWWMQKEIKEGIRSGAPGGVPYKPYSDITTGKLLDRMRGRKRLKRGGWQAPRSGSHAIGRHVPMGRLYNAVRYKYYGDSMRVFVGWLSKTAERMGLIQEKGGFVVRSNRMERFYWAAGLHLAKYKSKPLIKFPARPTIGPEYRQNAPKVPKYIENKLWGYLRKVEAK